MYTLPDWIKLHHMKIWWYESLARPSSHSSKIKVKFNVLYTSTLQWGQWSAQAPAILFPSLQGKQPWVPLNMELGGYQSWTGCAVRRPVSGIELWLSSHLLIYHTAEKHGMQGLIREDILIFISLIEWNNENFMILTHYYTLLRWSCPITDLHRPLGIQKVDAPRISNQSALEGGKVVSPTQRMPLACRKYPWYSFLLEAELTPGP
jgi:hypothetical protein